MAAHRQFFNQNKPKSTDGIFKHVLESLPHQAQGIAFDLCCGAGELTAELTQCGYRAYGIDISDRFIGSQGSAAQGFIVADVTAVPLTANSATLITFIDSLQYMSDPNAVLAEAARLLQPGGHLILSSQNNYNPAGIKKWLLQGLTGKPWSPWLVHPVENFMTYPALIRMLEENGFEIEYIRGKQFLTAWVSLLPSFIRNWTPWRDKPWRSMASVASRIHLPDRIEESFLSRFAMITFIKARKV